ncbi:MAG: DUF4173 domain-containing protein [Chloroflexi bacterium]|nr:DUF4173 domain-containing protein [Chloroflexota bacterium]
MSDTTKLGVALLGAALLVGLLADALLRTAPWGVNLALWVAGLLLAGALVARWRATPLSGAGRWLALPALLLAGGLAWRDSGMLTTLNLLALGGTLALLALRAGAGRLRVSGVATWLGAPLISSLYSTGGPLPPLMSIPWATLPRGAWRRPALSVGLGLVIAAPLLLIFGGLFAAADAAFAHVFNEVVRWLVTELAAHVVVTGFAAWVVAGWLHQTLLARSEADLIGPWPRRYGLGVIELAIVLGLLDALFAVFVAIQAPYLFGGAALVATDPALTYAEYARRGFFELITVAALALPLLLLLDWLRRDRAGDEGAEAARSSAAARLFVALAGGLVALLMVVLASAAQRLWLYTSIYGLTEQRLYAAAAMVWLAVVSLWFAATALAGRRDRFAFGAAVAAASLLLTLNLANPDALIVGVNAGRASAAQSFDARYVASLSADAAPALVAALPALKPAEQRTVAAQLLRRWETSTEPDWRSWNWGRWQARQVVQAEVASLARISAGRADTSTNRSAVNTRQEGRHP